MFDLHVHTSASDGTLSPFDTVRLAKKHGVRYIAITDHDTVSGIEEAIRASLGGLIKVIPGVELSVEVAQGEVHILGYFIDIYNRELVNKLKDLRKGRIRRVDKIISNLCKKKNIIITKDEIEKFSLGESIGRPHIARALIDKGLVKNMNDAFDMYLGKDSDCYVPRDKLFLKEAINLILGAGGLPVLAHPGLINNFSSLFDNMINYGLIGIEAYYPLHTPLQRSHFLSLAQRYDLIVTAGSDFHGPKGRKIKHPGCPGVPHSVIENFLSFYKGDI